VRELGLDSERDIVAAQWGAHGPHEPGFVLVADRRAQSARAPRGHLVLAIRGTLSAADALTDLRCDAGEVALGDSVGGQRVHTGMWESAVLLDAKVRDSIQAVLATGGACEGMLLVVVGHRCSCATVCVCVCVCATVCVCVCDRDVRLDVPCAYTCTCTCTSAHICACTQMYVYA